MLAPKFKLKNQDGIEIALEDLSSKTLVLYFYPKDNTSGCTTQAQDFTNHIEEFEDLNAIVVGISPDSIESHKKFILKNNLKITLLSDPQREVATKYGAYGKKIMYGKESMGIIRSTFIIKNNEIIQSFKNVRVKGHIQKVIETLQNLATQKS